MGVTPLTFTGTSQYSSDFQSILTRAVNIANIPLQQLQNSDQTDISKTSELGSLQSDVAALTTSISSLGTLASGQAIGGDTSNSSAVTFTASGATEPASYTINSVTSLATSASETSKTGYTNSSSTVVSSTGAMQLVVGTNTFAISLTSAANNLVGVENAINGLNAGVTASILTTGNGNYLSISSNSLGATTLRLNDDPTGANTNLLTSANQGTNAVFQLNNLTVTRSQNTVNDLIPGATLTLQAPTTTPVTLTLSSDPSQLSDSIQTLVSSYNAVVKDIDAQSGKAAGVLSGDSIIWQLQGAMRQLTTFQGSGSIKNLSDMGINLASDGTMSLDQSTFDSLSQSQLQGAFQFFGSATTAFGGLSQTMSQISDPISGAIADEQATLGQDDVSLQSQITTMTANINTMQNNLFTQLSKSDTLISQLDTQQNEVTASIASLNYVLFGKSTSSS